MYQLRNFVVEFLKREDAPTPVECAVMLVFIIIVCIAAIRAVLSLLLLKLLDKERDSHINDFNFDETILGDATQPFPGASFD